MNTINSFKKKNDNNFNFEVEEIENIYKELSNIKTEIERFFKKKKEFFFSFEYLLKISIKIKIEDINKVIQVLSEINNLIKKNYNSIKPEILYSIMSINIQFTSRVPIQRI